MIMTNPDETKKYIEGFKDKVKSRLKIYRKEDGKERIDAAGLTKWLKKNNIYNYLNNAEQNANIGTTIPSLSGFSILKRTVYRLVIKFLFKIFKVITLNQRQYNMSVLDAFRLIIDECNNLKLGLADAKTYSGAKIDELEFRFKQQNIEIYEIKKIMDYIKNTLIQIELKINNLPEARDKGADNVLVRKPVDLNGEINHELDAFYVFLEDNLRGSSEEIKKRLQIYLPVVKKINAGLKSSPILDIGCGRGEWLELLREENLYARGLDINRAMVETCRKKGLDVVEGEALSFLKGAPDSSIGAVTGFHFIEHYRFDFLIKLLKEILRVLKSGGLVILETPNPANIIVGSCNFYADPTHNNPLPGPLSKLILESQGFSRVKIMCLNPFEDNYKIKDSDSEISKRFNDYFYGPQDYAVIGYKI